METITIEMIKAHIAATYDVVPYIEWSKQAEQELEIAAYTPRGQDIGSQLS